VASSSTTARFDVAIIGFGPVGATLAGLLGKRGARVIVLDREADIYPLPRAAHIDHQSLRVFQELGVLHALLPQMCRNPGVDFVTARREILLRIPSDQPSVSGLPLSMYFYQPVVDGALRATARALPSVAVELRRTVTALELSDDGVTIVHGATGFGQHGERWVDGDARRTVDASWVVGCDGARSTVRAALEIQQESLDFHEQWVVVDLILERPVPSLPDRALAVCDPARPMFAIPMPGRRFRFELMLMPGEDPIAMASPMTVLGTLLAQWVPHSAARVERSAVYDFRGLVARHWRHGRVLIAGDAAHQMPPFLGQGMNSGVRDSANLAWKLDLVLRRMAPDRLLDTYELERRPHVRAIVAAAVDFGRILCETDPERAAERDRRLFDSGLSPIDRARFALPPLTPGPLVAEGGGSLFPQEPGFSPGEGLDDVVGPLFLVAGLAERDIPVDLTEWWTAHGARVTTISGLGSHALAVRRWLERRDANVVVVRPDRYVLGVGRNLAKITSEVAATLGP
jgi:2-polyprenyl-6-methoxyphenol hydroxylase-like FAD-dependent oxidoreductase